MAKSAFSSRDQIGQRFLSGSSILRSNGVLVFVVGSGAFVAALVLRFWMDEALRGLPFITFIPAVIISAFLAGTRGGVLCAVLSFIAAWYWFLDPPMSFSISYGAAVALGFFTFICVVDIALIHSAARAINRLTLHEAELNETQSALEDAVRGRDVLLYEVNHRVKNSLQLVSSFLLLETSKISDSHARSAVMTARVKVDLVARLHQLLYASGSHDSFDFKDALEDIVTHLVSSSARDDVNLKFSLSGDLVIGIRQASPLVLAVNEIVTNSLKHGLGSTHPQLIVTAQTAGNEMTLVIRDNGPGISAASCEKTSGVGNDIIKGLVSQMRGTFVIQSDGSGTTNTLTVPLNPQSLDRKKTS